MDTVQMVRNAQMDMLLEVKRICGKHNIPYFLEGGTLIGAIRHKGFIPWDDDIDVAMLRQDYNRFIEACREDLDPAYALYDWHKDPASPLPFLKMKIKGTHYREFLARNTDMNDELYIDIFPFDNVPDSKLLRKVHGWQVWLVRRLLLVRGGFELDRGDWKRKLFYGALNVASCVRSFEAWKRCCEKLMNKYNGSLTAEATNLSTIYRFSRHTMPRRMITELGEATFEGEKLSVPKDYHGYLSKIYGDYMSPPPVEKQEGHHEIVNVDFGDYRIRFQSSAE